MLNLLTKILVALALTTTLCFAGEVPEDKSFCIATVNIDTKERAPGAKRFLFTKFSCDGESEQVLYEEAADSSHVISSQSISKVVKAFLDKSYNYDECKLSTERGFVRSVWCYFRK